MRTGEIVDNKMDAQTEAAIAGSVQRPCCAALLEIIKTCEEYQNADFEGKELLCRVSSAGHPL